MSFLNCLIKLTGTGALGEGGQKIDNSPKSGKSRGFRRKEKLWP